MLWVYWNFVSLQKSQCATTKPLKAATSNKLSFKYFLPPPPGCPHTPKQIYWKLQRTLYELKRSHRHWFDKAASLLQQLGLKPCPNDPSIFKSEIMKGKPPLTLGLYVDDLVYFYVDNEVEKIPQLTKVDRNIHPFSRNASPVAQNPKPYPGTFIYRGIYWCTPPTVRSWYHIN